MENSVANEDWELGRKLWDYLRWPEEPMQPADAIIVFGSNDVRVAARGAELYREGVAPVVVTSGGNGNFTSDWSDAEAVVFAHVLRHNGVPSESILVEQQSTNTGENLSLSLALLRHEQVQVQRLVLVHKPFMERRAKATADIVCPHLRVAVTGPLIDFDAYPNDVLTRRHILEAMVGDLDRVVTYPSEGFQTEQQPAAAVLDAASVLKRRGYTSHSLYS